MSGALVAGSVVGYLLRIPLAPFVSLDPSTYVHPEQAGRTLAFFAALTDDRAGSARGDAELLLLFAGVVLAVGGTVWAWRVRTARTVLVATVLPLVTVVAVSVGVVVAGSQTPRYLEPIVTVPLLALVAVAGARALRRPPDPGPPAAARRAAGRGGRGGGRPGRWGGRGTEHGRCRRIGPVRTGGVPRPLGDGRKVTGVGQFWTVRPLAAYASDDVELLQVRDTFETYPWLVDLGAYRDAEPTFVVIGANDVWTTAVEDSLGAPATITHCTGFDVYDYAGTVGAAGAAARRGGQRGRDPT